MRRVLAVIGLIGLGVLLGFALRLLWPRRTPETGGYSAPTPTAPTPMAPGTWPQAS